jgi:hypothetical protein
VTSNDAPNSPDLDAIETRTNAATPGPWCTDSWEIYQGTAYVPGISMWIGETCRGTTSPEQDRADAEFVAAARTDVPALLAEVARLKRQREYLLGQLAKRDAESGREEAALRKLLASEEPICGDENDGDWCELETGHDGNHRADTAEWAPTP